MIASKRRARRNMTTFECEQAQYSGVYGDGYTWPRGQHWPKSFASKRTVGSGWKEGGAIRRRGASS